MTSEVNLACIPPMKTGIVTSISHLINLLLPHLKELISRPININLIFITVF